MASLARLSKGVLLALALLIAGGGIGEASLRVAARLRHGTWPQTRAAGFYLDVVTLRQIFRPHAYLNTGPREGARVTVFGKTAAFNSLGYRSPERPLAKGPRVRRVLLSGGSTTFDVSAANDETTWPRALERALSSQAGGIEVWNTGFPGWTSLENVLSFALRDRDLDPDVVVLYQGINDLQPGSHRAFDRQYEHGHAEVARRALGFDLEPPGLAGRSLLLEAIADRLRGGASDPWAALGAREPPPRHDRLDPAAPVVFARNLRSFAALVSDSGAQLVLATQPLRIRARDRDADLHYLEGWYPELVATAAPGELARLNEVTRAVALERGLGLADVAREIDWRDEDFADPLHYSDAGRQKLVGYFAPRLAALLAHTPLAQVSLADPAERVPSNP